MKILIIASYADSVVTFRGHLIRELVASGCEVFVAAPGLSGNTLARSFLSKLNVGISDVPLNRNGKNPLADLWLLVRLIRLMSRVRPTLILTYTIKPVIYGVLAAWLYGVRWRYPLITGLGYAFTAGRFGLVGNATRLLYGVALERATKVFFQNPDDESLFRRYGIISSKIPSVVLNGSGVDVSEFGFEEIAGADVVYLMIGRLLGDKGVREYVQAAQRVKLRFPSARFQLAGWIDSNPDAISSSELDAWVASGVIEFLGKLDDVRLAIRGATVYVLPSYREGTPRTVLESMAMGRPVITTDAPGCRETVIDGENGFLVPVKSVDALVEAMLKFIEDPMLAPRMGKRSREIAEEKYDVHKVNAVMLREMGIIPSGEENTHA